MQARETKMGSDQTGEATERPIFPIWLIWAGLVGLEFAAIGLLWSYYDLSLWRAAHEAALRAGLDVESQPPVFPRALALLGLWLVTMTSLTICGTLLVRLRQCLIRSS